MTKDEILALKEKAEAAGVAILSKEDYNNHLAAKAAEVTRTTAEKLEQSVFGLSSVPKLPNEKYFDYVERVLKLGQEAKAELETVKGKNLDQILVAKDNQLAELRAALAGKDAEYGQKIEEINAQAFQKDVKRAYQQAVASLAARAKKIEGVNTPEIVAMKAELAFKGILEKYQPVKDANGEIVGFVDAGQPADTSYVKREATTGRALDFSDFLAPELKDYITAPGQRVVPGVGNDNQAAAIDAMLHATMEQVFAHLRAAQKRKDMGLG